MISPAPTEVGDELPPRPKALPAWSAVPARIEIDRPGERLAGSPVEGYEILREVGRGGMGVVYEARQLSLNRIVALKMVLAGAHAGVEELLRFRTEAEAGAALQHPNIVQIYEVGQAGGQPYLALEFVGGGNLAQKLAEAPLPAGEAAELVETLARAVHYAHERGVIHRDLKPANVLLSFVTRAHFKTSLSDAITCRMRRIHFIAGVSRGFEMRSSRLSCERAEGQMANDHGQVTIPKITDFGLAKHVEAFEKGTKAPDDTLSVALTQTGAALGTPSYMAPEQALGQRGAIGPATDVYALGAILYEALTGRPPFRAPTPLETLQQVVSEEPVPLSRLQAKLRGDLETICLKCLQKEPAKRYTSAAALANDLHRFLRSEPIVARRTGTAERLWRWCRRNPKVAGLLTALVVVFLVGFAGVTLQWQSAERQREQADKNYRLARRVVNDYFASLGRDPLLEHAGALPLREELLDTALRHFQDLRQQRDDEELQVHLARACFCLGQIRANDGRYTEAIARYQQAIEIQEQLVRDHGAVVAYQRDLARSYAGLAGGQTFTKQFTEAHASHQKALAIRARLHAADPADRTGRLDLASSYNLIGLVYHQRAEAQKIAAISAGSAWSAALPENDQALTRYREARGILEQLANEEPDDLACQSQLSASLNNLGLTYMSIGQPQEALEVFEAAIGRQKPVFRQAKDAARYRQMIATHHFNMARHALLPLGREREAVEAGRRARDLNREDPFNLWRAARVLALASENIAAGGTSADTKLASELADEAVWTLTEAVEMGMYGDFDSPELHSLRGREDFQELVIKLAKQTAAAKKK